MVSVDWTIYLILLLLRERNRVRVVRCSHYCCCCVWRRQRRNGRVCLCVCCCRTGTSPEVVLHCSHPSSHTQREALRCYYAGVEVQLKKMLVSVAGVALCPHNVSSQQLSPLILSRRGRSGPCSSSAVPSTPTAAVSEGSAHFLFSQ